VAGQRPSSLDARGFTVVGRSSTRSRRLRRSNPATSIETAQALGIVLPQSILLIANEVIQ